jgi:hypothetical protein
MDCVAWPKITAKSAPPTIDAECIAAVCVSTRGTEPNMSGYPTVFEVQTTSQTPVAQFVQMRPHKKEVGMVKTIVATLALAGSLVGCAGMRKVEVGADPTATYSILVTNNRTATVSVAYGAANGERVTLGTVAARGGRERFIIAGASDRNVTVYVTTSGGAAIRSYSVQLEPGVSTPITVQ